jgi:imidazolonepropionase-like amidohydrolase
MKYSLLFLVLLSFLCGTTVAIPSGPTPIPITENVTAFVGVHVIPMDEERILENQTVIVEGDRITTVGPASEVTIPDGAIRIDGSGKYLMPGLAEMHGHIPPTAANADFIESVLFMYVANGITTVRGMLGSPNQLELRAQAKAGTLLSPTLYLAGPSFNGNSVSSPEQARAMVRTQKQEGWDLLKIHPGLTQAEYDAMAETANELGIRFGGHVPSDVGLIHALDKGQETFDHLDGYIEYLNGDTGPLTDEQLAEVVNRTREAGAWVVPTMVLWETLFGVVDLETLSNFPELKYMPSSTVQSWIQTHKNRLSNPQLDLATSKTVIDNRMRLLAALHKGGVRILMGTDAPQQFSVPGFSLHRELVRMADAGMSPFEIIKTGTVHVGEYFKAQDTFGQVAEGHRADLILINSNPLEDVSHIKDRSGVMVRGRWLAEAEIQNKLAEIAAVQP